MKEEFINLLLKTKALRIKKINKEEIKSMIESAEKTAKFAVSLSLNQDSATAIFREIYESIRLLGDAYWWSLGYEPRNHEISLDILREADIKEKTKLNYLSRFKKIRNDINYRGYLSLISQTEEIIDFWNSSSQEIILIIKNRLI